MLNLRLPALSSNTHQTISQLTYGTDHSTGNYRFLRSTKRRKISHRSEEASQNRRRLSSLEVRF